MESVRRQIVLDERAGYPYVAKGLFEPNISVPHDGQLFYDVSLTNPGLVSTLVALEGHLKTGPLPPPQVLHRYGRYLTKLGAAVIDYVDRQAMTIIDPDDTA
uniref:Uncharacterized protein n=1 Tax=Thermocrispum agreste TaxID=37925 RepID=A0A2W4LDK0_9PSEU|nr:MAG: hypothetical protein DIU77_12120 [Thermocrispum agreste]